MNLSSLTLTLLLLATMTTSQASSERIVTGGERGTYIQIGRDLARHVAQPVGIRLETLASKGSTENVRRLRNEPGVRLALVQSDVIQAFLDEAARGDVDAMQLIKPLRAVMPLYDEEIHFVVRADSPLNAVHEIRDQRINIGPSGSGTALTATTLYRKMFGTSIYDQNVSNLSNEDALLKLTRDGSIDVVVVVAGQPTKLFADVQPEAREFIKLLRFDPSAAPSRAAAEVYTPSVIRASSYPNLLRDDIAALTTRALLVTYDYQTPQTKKMLVRFARSLCENFDQLQSSGHPKWRDVRLEMPALGGNWNYYAPTERELMACKVDRYRSLSGSLVSDCSQSRAVLGLCNTVPASRRRTGELNEQADAAKR